VIRVDHSNFWLYATLPLPGVVVLNLCNEIFTLVAKGEHLTCFFQANIQSLAHIAVGLAKRLTRRQIPNLIPLAADMDPTCCFASECGLPETNKIAIWNGLELN
jgi:hypothetical protein